MQAVRQRDNAYERALRSALHGTGLRFRIQRAVLPELRRRADIVFVRAQVIVFVDGCFWHCCPQHRTFPKANHMWWRRKLAKNVARDRDTDKKLSAAGWLCVHVWEHEAVQNAAARISKIVQRRLSLAE
jgi:DNA mismatch endonuclease (patch repair protein)